VRLVLVYHQMVGRGGLEKYLLALARGLKGRGHAVRLVTAQTDAAFEGLECPRVRLGWVGVPRWARLAVFAWRSAAVPVDPDELVLGFGRTWSQDIHRAGGGCHALYSGLLPWWRRWTLKNQVELALERRLYQGGETRHFVVNASPVAEQLHRVYGVPRDRISVIHTAVDTQRFCPASQREADSGEPPASRPILLFVSSNHRRKGLPALLRAMASVPEADLWIAGARLSRRDRRFLATAGLQGRVREWGEVEDLVPLYRQATWFVHPTLYDACANTVLQSMACALPGLISVADGASEFIKDGENGLLIRDPADSRQLAELLRLALSLPVARRLALGGAARRTVESLTWSTHLDAWEALCLETLRQKSNSR
jgi:UDP-glucose:(heptosyl)LPS alpha-1,3-glucosyltransferase